MKIREVRGKAADGDPFAFAAITPLSTPPIVVLDQSSQWVDDADFRSDAEVGTPDVFVVGGIVTGTDLPS